MKKRTPPKQRKRTFRAPTILGDALVNAKSKKRVDLLLEVYKIIYGRLP